MYRLAELSDSRRKSHRMGTARARLRRSRGGGDLDPLHEPPPEQDAGIFDWIPSNHLLKGVGYLVVFGASQMLVVGALFVWVLNQRMTWARALFASFFTWIEFVMIFGMVPSEWLNFSQTDLDWSSERWPSRSRRAWCWVTRSRSAGPPSRTRSRWAITWWCWRRRRCSRFSSRDEEGPARIGRKGPHRSPYGRPLIRGGG